MAKTKFYVVWKGRKPGIYNTWPECQKQVKGYPGARFKSFPTKAEAEQAFAGETKEAPEPGNSNYIEESVSVDVGSKGNPGPVEYKGVYTKTGEILFEHPVFPKGTNNMGEFLAIVHALQYLKEKNSSIPIYSDSMTALKWVKDKKIKSTLGRDKESEPIWKAVDNAETWLKENSWNNSLMKWETKQWGEIKADYGRK